MKTNNRSLESYRIFPFVAWATVISFAFFTYTLAANLQRDLDDISDSVTRVESSLQTMQAQRAEQ